MNNNPIASYRDRLTRALITEGIPAHMHSGILEYLINGILHGDFLTAVLNNDLCGAVKFADDINIHHLPNYVRFLYNNAPSAAWGSPKRVDNWIKDHSEVI